MRLRKNKKEGFDQMKVLAIDPGSSKSAYVVYDIENKSLVTFGIDENEVLIKRVKKLHSFVPFMLVEQVKNYGMLIGDTLLMTVFWSGRFVESWGGDAFSLIPRKTIVTSLCGNARAKDKNVRRAILDRFSTASRGGFGKEPALGNKSHPGPIYGVSKDVFSALALALYWEDLVELEKAKLNNNIN